MDSYYFLHNGSLSNINYSAYKSGLMALNSLIVELLSGEKVIKNNAVYDNPLYVKLFNDYAETDGIVKFIEQCTSVENNIDSDVMFESIYPMQNVGFMGVNFTKITGIAHERQIVDSMSLYNCRNLFFVRLIKEGQDKDLPLLLKYRFPTFVFSNDAQNDLLWWKNKNVDVINTIIDLLDDIPRNPFTGGLGKTEVLSKTTNPVVSKRITQKDRLTYTYGKMTKIHRCKEHY